MGEPKAQGRGPVESDVQVQEDRVIVKPVGRVDSTVAEEFQRRLLGTIAAYATPVELDCSAMPYISSPGLRVLALAAKALGQHAQRLRIIQPTAVVLSTLTLSDFTSFLDVVT
jgi:anti-anti-sigma factor